MDLSVRARASPWAWLPRLRGDGPYLTRLNWYWFGAAPPTRGWTLLNSRLAHQLSGGPAYAGMDPSHGLAPRHTRRRPRLRGDGIPDEWSYYGLLAN